MRNPTCWEKYDIRIVTISKAQPLMIPEMHSRGKGSQLIMAKSFQEDILDYGELLERAAVGLPVATTSVQTCVWGIV